LLRGRLFVRAILPIGCKAKTIDTPAVTVSTARFKFDGKVYKRDASKTEDIK
jgi:hypothetical protein